MAGLQSAIYRGSVFHKRTSPKLHAFRYDVFMVYLDLDELDAFFSLSRWWSCTGWALARFKRADFHGDKTIPLTEAVKKTVEQQLGFRPEGPVRMLANLRYFGYIMNPLVVYYCFDKQGEKLEAMVAEVNNTPWNEKHPYVLDCRSNQKQGSQPKPSPANTVAAPNLALHRHEFEKAFTVSPFNPVNMTYLWQSSLPAKQLIIHIQNTQAGQQVFEASLALKREPATAQSLRNCLIRYPFFTVKVITAIYWQALKLFVKGVPFLGKNAVQPAGSAQNNERTKHSKATKPLENKP